MPCSRVLAAQGVGGRCRASRRPRIVLEQPMEVSRAARASPRARQRAGRRRAVRRASCSTPPRPARARCLCRTRRQDRPHAGAHARIWPSWSRWTVDAARLERVRAEPRPTRPGARRCVEADLLDPALVGRPALRPHPPRRALLGNRRDPPPSGHQAAAPPRRHSRASPSQQRRMLARCAAMLRPGRPADLRHLLGTAGRESATWWMRFLREPPRISRRARADLTLLPTPAAGSGAGALTDGFYYACLQEGDWPGPEGRRQLWTPCGYRQRLDAAVALGLVLALLLACAPLARAAEPGIPAVQLCLRQRAGRRVRAERRAPIYPAERRRAPALDDGVTVNFDLQAVVQKRAATGSTPTLVDATLRRELSLARGERALRAADVAHRRPAVLHGARRGAGRRRHRCMAGRWWSSRSSIPTPSTRSACAPACAAAACPMRCAR